MSWVAVRRMSAVSITIRRLKRSPITPPASRKMTTGVAPAAATNPTSATVPWRRTAKDTATGAMPLPSWDVACPKKNIAKLRS